MKLAACTVAVAAALFAGSAWAEQFAPVLYSRATLTVVRQNPPVDMATKPLPWQENLPPVMEAPETTLEVEVRDAQATLSRQEGWMSFSAPSEKSGLLLPFDMPDLYPVRRMEQYAPLDILMIDKEGKITQIAPNITLATLEADIVPAKPLLAFLFLRGGSCEKLSIAPGDWIEYPLFKKPPPVLSVR